VGKAQRKLAKDAAAAPEFLHERLTCTIDEARKIVGIGRSTVYRLIAEEKLETRHVYGRCLVTMRSIRALLALDEAA
jgi:excisionase family DNA binding protein